MDIQLWRCHICSEEFDTPYGGLCQRCNKPTCWEDLRLVEANNDNQTVCKICVRENEIAKPYELS
jgi:hypothetical protein